GSPTPLEPYRDIIGVGVFADWKPKPRRRWSRAVARHGADPRRALGAALGVAAEDIQVRGAAGSEPPATANTAPRPPPPGPPTPIRGRRRSPITPRQTFLLETTSKGRCRGGNQSRYTSPRPRGGVPRGRHRRTGLGSVGEQATRSLTTASA